MNIKPGSSYRRAGVVVTVLRERSGPPEAWGKLGLQAARKLPGKWYDVLNLASDTDIDFHTPGRIVAWHESLFERAVEHFEAQP